MKDYFLLNYLDFMQFTYKLSSCLMEAFLLRLNLY